MEMKEWMYVCQGLLKDAENQKLVCYVYIPIYSSPCAFPLPSFQSTHGISVSFLFWKVMLTCLCASIMLQVTLNSLPTLPYSSHGAGVWGVKESETSTWARLRPSTSLSLSATLSLGAGPLLCSPGRKASVLRGGLGLLILGISLSKSRWAKFHFTSDLMSSVLQSAKRSHSDLHLSFSYVLALKENNYHYWFPRTPNQTSNSYVYV